MSSQEATSLLETGAGGFRCRGWRDQAGAHHACQTRTMAQHWDGQCYPCSRQEATAQRALAGLDLGARPTTTPILRVEMPPQVRQWHRDFAACRGWGADREEAHHACEHLDADHFEAGRCWYCHTAHSRWLARGGQEAASPAQARVEAADAVAEAAVAAALPPVVPAPAAVGVETKRCARCREEKREESFSASMWAATRTAGSRWCRPCEREYHDEYKARQTAPLTAPAAASAPPVAVALAAVAELAVEPVAALVAAARETGRAAPAQTVTPRWVVFDCSPAVPAQEPWLAWQRGGLVAFPAVTLALLGSPTHVRLLWDADLRLFGVEAVTAATEYARALPPAQNQRGTVSLSVRALIKRFGLAGVRPGRYRVQQYGAVVAIHLPEADEAFGLG